MASCRWENKQWGFLLKHSNVVQIIRCTVFRYEQYVDLGMLKFRDWSIWFNLSNLGFIRCLRRSLGGLVFFKPAVNAFTLYLCLSLRAALYLNISSWLGSMVEAEVLLCPADTADANRTNRCMEQVPHESVSNWYQCHCCCPCLHRVRIKVTLNRFRNWWNTHYSVCNKFPHHTLFCGQSVS